MFLIHLYILLSILGGTDQFRLKSHYLVARHACPHWGQGIGHEVMGSEGEFPETSTLILNQIIGFKSGSKNNHIFFFDTIKNRSHLIEAED